MKKLFTITFLGLLLACTTLNAQVTDGLIEEFKFNNLYSAEIGIAVSVTMNAGTSFVADRNNNPNSALHINNNGANATIPNLPYGNSARSFSFWVKLDEHNAGGYNFVYSYGYGSANSAYGTSVSANNTVQFAWGNDHTAADATPIGVWKHVVVTYDGTLSKIYSNGILVGTNTKAWNTQNSANVFKFGTGAGGEKWFKGAIDDFKIYNRAITETEVKTIYNTENGIIAKWNFDNSYTDVTGNISLPSNTATSFTADRHGNANGAININSTIDAPNMGTSAAVTGLPYGNSQRTFSFWVKMNQILANPAGLNYVFSYGTSANGNMAVSINSTTTALMLGSDSYLINDDNRANAWQHYAITFDGTSTKVYKNGFLLGNSSKVFNGTNNSDVLRFGAGTNTSWGNAKFNGAIDDFTIYNKALTAQEVLALNGGLIQEFTFDNTYSNTFGNISFASNPGTSFTHNRNGEPNKALNINGTGTTAVIPNLPYTNTPRTISVWVKPNGTLHPSYNPVYSYGTVGTGSSNGGGITPTQIQHMGYLDNHMVNANATINNYTWYHLVYVYNGTTSKIYRDGVLLGSTDKTNWSTINNSDIFKLGIGVGGELDFNGAIDDLKIFNRTLTDQEILNLKNTNNILPVNLVSFTAKAQNNAAVLNWQTASETNNSHFTVKHSTNGVDFVTLTNVTAKSANGASYQYIHNQPASGTNYYQLLQIDLDGKTTGLGTKTVTLNLTPYTVSLSPNPTANEANVSFAQGVFHSAKLVNVNGQILQLTTIGKTQQTLTLNLGNYPNGVYFIQLQGNNQNSVQKVIKQ